MSKPLLTEFGIHHRLDSCELLLTFSQIVVVEVPRLVDTLAQYQNDVLKARNSGIFGSTHDANSHIRQGPVETILRCCMMREIPCLYPTEEANQ